jgi:hypothetical protein
MYVSEKNPNSRFGLVFRIHPFALLVLSPFILFGLMLWLLFWLVKLLLLATVGILTIIAANKERKAKKQQQPTPLKQQPQLGTIPPPLPKREPIGEPNGFWA